MHGIFKVKSLVEYKTLLIFSKLFFYRFGYNKTKTAEGPQQAGVVFGFGLSGILKNMPPTLRHDYLAKENSFTTMAMLLGLSANLAGRYIMQHL